MTKTKATGKKTAKKTSAQRDWSVEERVYRLRRRLRMMQLLYKAHINLGEAEAWDILAGIEEMVDDCLVEVDAIAKAPASIMNWSPAKGGER